MVICYAYEEERKNDAIGKPMDNWNKDKKVTLLVFKMDR